MNTFHKENDLCPRCKEGKLIQNTYDYEMNSGEIVKVTALVCDFCKYEAEITKTEE